MRAAPFIVGAAAVVAIVDWTPRREAVRPTGEARSAGFAPGFIAATFARRSTGTAELAARFSWPSVTAFQATYDGGIRAEPMRVVQGRVLWWTEPEGAARPLGEQTVAELIARGEAQVRLTGVRQAEADRELKALESGRIERAAFARLVDRMEQREAQEGVGVEEAEVTWALRRGIVSEATVFGWCPGSRCQLAAIAPRASTSEWFKALDQPFVHAAGRQRFVFLPSGGSPVGAVDTKAWQDWAYTTTLMTMDRPLYENTRLDALAWDDVATFAEDLGAIELAVAIRARHLPVGRCSMDTNPADAARRYAALCYAAGRLACFLNLQVQIMGDQFERVVASTYGEAGHETGAGRLSEVGIDVAKFLRGLLYQFDLPGVDRRELDAWRLARSIVDAKLDEPLGHVLRAEAARAELDDWNRFRAAQTLAYLRLHQRDVPITAPPTPATEKRHERRLRDIRDELSRLNLPAPAATWARRLGQSD